jgi:PBP1b-binding outer membrane lipoprotein LpoB
MKNVRILIVTILLFVQGCASTKDSVNPTIPKPPVVFSSIDK